MATLREMAKVIRSKNAGALQFTLDVMFEDVATYEKIRDSGVLTPRNLAPLYGVTDNEVAVIPFDVAYAIKVTLPRKNTVCLARRHGYLWGAATRTATGSRSRRLRITVGKWPE